MSIIVEKYMPLKEILETKKKKKIALKLTT